MRIGLVVCVFAIALSFAEVGAAPLDAESCARLKGEQTLLEHSGARGNMLRGPQWAKANLTADKLGQIRRLIEVDEQLLFRCRGGKALVELPPEPEADPAAAPPEASEDGKEAPAGADKKAAPKAAAPKKGDAAKAVPAAKPAPAAKAATPARQDGAPPSPEAAAKPKPKPKPKADDAYKAAPADPKLNPFTTETSPAKN
jgi:hypothetical protein